MKTRRKVAIICGVILCAVLISDMIPESLQVLHITAGIRSGTNREQTPSGNQSLPDVIIFGTRKCGTRALLTFLGAHAQITAKKYETHFFNRNYKRGLEWYREQMPPARPGQLTLEKTPGYFIHPLVPERVYAMNRDIKLLLIVREPVTRAISDYTQRLYNHHDRNQTTEPFEQLAIHPVTHEVNLEFTPLLVSVYHVHIKNWLKYFPMSQIHIVDGDRLISDPASELTRVEAFLGLEPYLTEDKFFFNNTRGFYCMRIGNADQCLGNKKGRNHPEIDPKVLQKLKTFYKLHNAIFFSYINRTFEWS